MTYLIERAGAEVVLRRPPRAPLPPSAHDVLREARLLQALAATPARVPAVLAVCDDDAVIGCPFYVMERVPGEVIVSSVPAALDTPAERRRIGEQLIDALVEIHAVDWQAAGLEGFGKPTGYLSASCAASAGCGSSTRRARSPRSSASARGWPSTCPESGAGDDRARRLPPGQHDLRRRRPRAA